MRLIDADALYKCFERVGWNDNADREQAEALILEATTIDFKTDNTAVWKFAVMYPNGVVEWICSKCRNSSFDNSAYCPHCGAEMDDEEEYVDFVEEMLRERKEARANDALCGD